MTLLAILTAHALLSQEPVRPSLEITPKGILVKSGALKSLIDPVAAPPKPRENILFRRDNAFVVWDPVRGLTVRVGSYVYSSKLAEVAVTRKLFSPLEIHETVRLVAQKKRTREAGALSGARRLGKDVYLLLRWLDSDGKTWLEALVKVDLSQPRPKPQLVGRFDGASLADKRLDDRLFVIEGTLGIVSRLGSSWGVSRYEPESNAFSSLGIGESLRSYSALTPRVVMFMEETPYGTTLLGRADLGSGARRNLLETRGLVSILDKVSPMIALIKHEGKLTFHNVETGAQIAGLAGGGVRRTPQGLLHWAPAFSPKIAMLLEPTRMELISAAEVTAATPAPAQPPSKSGARPASAGSGRPKR